MYSHPLVFSTSPLSEIVMEAYQSEDELRWTPLCLYFPNALRVTFANLFEAEYQCEDGHGLVNVFSHTKVLIICRVLGWL